MKPRARSALATAILLACLTGCKKDNTNKQTTSFVNQPLNQVLDAIHGRWRAVSSVTTSIAGATQLPVADTTIGYFTWFYSDHITYANQAGDSVSHPLSWRRVDYDGDSVYAFSITADSTIILKHGFAVLSVVNDTLSISSVDHGIDFGLGVLYKKN